METRELLRGGCENTNQRSPSQRREQAGESQGRPRKTRASGGIWVAGVWGGAARSEAVMGAAAVGLRHRAVGRDREKAAVRRPGVGLVRHNLGDVTFVCA
jgi:hypothetical protein